MEVPHVRRTPVSTYQTLLAGWTSLGRTALGRSAPEGGKEDREPQQRQEEQLAALRSSPSVRKRDRKFLPGSAAARILHPECTNCSPQSRRNRGSLVDKGLFRFLQIPRLCFRIFVDIRRPLSRNLNGRTLNQCGALDLVP